MADLLELRDGTAALLRAVPGLDLHVGRVDQVTLDPDGRAHPYAVLWVSTGRDDPAEEAVDTTAGQLVWSFQVTAAGGDDTRALWAAGKVLSALVGARLLPSSGVVRLTADPGPVREDAAVTPSRSYLPLLFTTDIN